ncbi:MAG: shikimate dehydrogenase [Lachnospiraceae bacterium]|nr:shikimate dehydrogenase [Lachnospiraceae bacterium]
MRGEKMQYGLIGEHLGHSYSPEIHAQIADYEYELKEIPKEELDSFMRAKDFKAINVTIPYKQDVIPYLDEISDQAAAIGAVNTIVNKDGHLWGGNTDFAGMSALIRKLGLDLTGCKVLILGTGGTSRTAMAVAKSLKAGEIFRVSRRGNDGAITYEDAYSDHADAQIIINTTPAGMYPNADGRSIDISRFPELKGVVDAVYNPIRTNLVLDAQERGIPAEGGLYMLSAQAVYACGAFLSREMDDAVIDRAYKNVLNAKRNIILTGMPSCGKTTIGKNLAKCLGRELTDTDRMVISKINMPIADYFAAKGENAFRDRESEAIKSIALRDGMLVATGGGAVLRKENVRDLKRNGVVIFLDRPLDKLISTDDRPLSSSREALEKRFNERYDIYKSCADITIDASGSIKQVTEKVLEALGLKDR